MDNKTAAPSGKRKKLILIICAVLLVAAIVTIVLVNIFGSQRTVKSTLEGYLNALYGECLIKHMTPFLVEDIRQICYDEFTFYGTTANLLLAYQQEKAEIVGDNLEVSIIINKEEAGTAAALKSASSSYGASALMDVTFTAVFKGDNGQADFTGIARLVKVSGKWYLTEYNLPLKQAD